MSRAPVFAPSPVSAAAPFSARTVLGLVAIGTALFVALLWMIGAGMVHGPMNDGGAHGASKGLTGYAALARLLENQGWDVQTARSEAELTRPGLVVLTPPPNAPGADLAKIVNKRRYIGPTLVIGPKWQGVPLSALNKSAPGAKPGWVMLDGTTAPEWKGFLDDVGVTITPLSGGGWFADHAAGSLPNQTAVLSGTGDSLIPLVEANRDGRILAAYVADGGNWPALDVLALQAAGDSGEDTGPDDDTGLYPLVVVFEPDLVNNYGMSRKEAALYALRLFNVTGTGAPRTVTFDLTLNGFKRSANLLTLAFTPPFLAATLCLLLAALMVGWRAFLRFGPARVGGPAIAFGKRQLVANAGGIVRRSGRLHLLAAPYAALVRERLARTLALPRVADSAAAEAAIDRALAARAPDATPFSHIAGQLRAARRPADLLRGAQALHALERMLTR